MTRLLFNSLGHSGAYLIIQLEDYAVVANDDHTATATAGMSAHIIYTDRASPKRTVTNIPMTFSARAKTAWCGLSV